MLFSTTTTCLKLGIKRIFRTTVPVTVVTMNMSKTTGHGGTLNRGIVVRSVNTYSKIVITKTVFALPTLCVLRSGCPRVAIGFFRVFIDSLLKNVLKVLFLVPFHGCFIDSGRNRCPFPRTATDARILISNRGNKDRTGPLLFTKLVKNLCSFVMTAFN